MPSFYESSSTIKSQHKPQFIASMLEVAQSKFAQLKNGMGLRLHNSTVIWPRREPYPWLNKAFAQSPGGNVFLMVGRNAGVLRTVHGYAVGAGFRPILVHVVEGSAKKLELASQHRRKDRCNLEFGTLVHHTSSLDIAQDLDAEEFKFGMSTITFPVLQRNDHPRCRRFVKYENVHVIDCDDQSDTLTDREYWSSKMVENARCYATPGFKDAFLPIMLTVVASCLMSFFCYHSTLIEDMFWSGFFRFGLLAATMYITMQSRYVVLHCIGFPEQSLVSYVVLVFVYEVIHIAMLCFTFADGRRLGDVPVCALSSVVHVAVVLGYIYIKTMRTSTIQCRTIVWSLVAAAAVPVCWIVTFLGVLAYLLLLPSAPISATIFVSFSFPLMNTAFIYCFKFCYRLLVEHQRESNPNAVPGSRQHGQCLPIVIVLGSFWAFTEMGSVLGILLGGFDESSGGKGAAARDLICCALVNICHRTDMHHILVE